MKATEISNLINRVNNSNSTDADVKIAFELVSNSELVEDIYEALAPVETISELIAVLTRESESRLAQITEIKKSDANLDDYYEILEAWESATNHNDYTILEDKLMDKMLGMEYTPALKLAEIQLVKWSFDCILDTEF